MCLACHPAPRFLTLATTTSVANSGLLDVLSAEYERAAHVAIRVHPVGSGRALAMLEGQQADVAITHAPEAEAAALAVHPRWRYAKIMFNDFVVVGPSADPAGAREASDAADAMRRIARGASRFISRGDQSGTHERELALWKAAGVSPKAPLLVAAGAGMGATLRIAAETASYTLTDRATFAQQRHPAQSILYEHDPALVNTYAVTFDPGAPGSREAERFAIWLADGAGRDVIDRYRVGGGKIRAFEVWPVSRSRTRPADLPLASAVAGPR